VNYSPVGGSSWLELPKEIKLKHACVNVKNEDHKCFMWSVLAALHHGEGIPNPGGIPNPSRINHYTRFANDLNFTNIEFPVKITNVKKFEKMNRLSVHVFGYEEGDILPL